MAPHIVVAPLLIALVTAVLTLFLRRAPRVQRTASLMGALAYLGSVALLAKTATSRSILVYQISG